MFKNVYSLNLPQIFNSQAPKGSEIPFSQTSRFCKTSSSIMSVHPLGALGAEHTYQKVARYFVNTVCVSYKNRILSKIILSVVNLKNLNNSDIILP